MLSNFSFPERELPYYSLLSSLIKSGKVSHLQSTIQSDFKNQINVPQNAFGRENLSRMLTIYNHLNKDKGNFKWKSIYSDELLQYKCFGKLKMSANSHLVSNLEFSKEDKNLSENFNKVLRKLISKNKRPNFAINKKFFEKLVLWLVKANQKCKIDPAKAVTLLKSLRQRRERKHFEEVKGKLDRLEANIIEEEEEEYVGLVYPKFEMILDFFEMPTPKSNVRILMGSNILARQNSFEEDSANFLKSSFWKIKDLKRFFIIFLMKTNDFTTIAKELGKTWTEVRLLFQITAEYFNLKYLYKEFKRSADKGYFKDVIKEIYDNVNLILESNIKESNIMEPSFPTNEIFVSLSTIADSISRQRELDEMEE